jgi:hypothetical protein
MAKRNDGVEQAKLILQLYELRREAVMRQARSFIGGEFLPQSAEDLVRLVSKGGQETGYILQVYGYWDMVCAFVVHGTLSEGLVYDTCQEMYFQFAKIQPYLKDFRRLMNLPEFMLSLEKVIMGSARGKKRVAAMRKNIETIREVRAQ